MNIPGFTAEASCIVPAMPIVAYSQSRLKTICTAAGGSFWGTGPTTATYGCMFKDGSGMVCGGVHDEDAFTCETWGK